MKVTRRFYKYGKHWYEVERVENDEGVVGLRKFNEANDRSEHYDEADGDKEDGLFHSDIVGINDIDDLFFFAQDVETNGELLGEDVDFELDVGLRECHTDLMAGDSNGSK